jgi:hypothetical protein
VLRPTPRLALVQFIDGADIIGPHTLACLVLSLF